MKHALMLAVAGLVLVACAGRTIMVGGIEVYESYWAETVDQLTNRARTELKCEQVEFNLLHKTGRQPDQVSAAGCGKTVIYSRTVQRVGAMGGPTIIGGWTLSSLQEG